MVTATVAAACAALAPAAVAATIPVTNDLDETTNNTQCSVREAITSANTNSNAHEDACVAGQPAPAVDTVDLIGTGHELLGNGDDTNATGDFDINDAGGPVVIDGEVIDGSIATNINADGLDRIFHVFGPAANPVTIRNIILNLGEVTDAAGGTILMGDADLTVDNVVVAFGTINGTSIGTMRGAGLAAIGQGTLTIRDSVIRENQIDASGAGAGVARGAGVFITPTTAATIDRSRIAENVMTGDGTGAGDAQNLLGAGIGTVDAGEDVTITNSLVAFNTVGAGDLQRGGGIDWDESGNNDLLRLTNVTFSGNGVAAGNGGGLYANGDAILSHTTFGPNTAQFGAGLFTSNGPVQVRNSLIETGTTADCGGSDPATSLGYNIERGPSQDCGFNQPTDQLANQPLLIALADNGGPTQTHRISNSFLDGVPAANCLGADGAPLTRDQRNALRPGQQTAACDAGAYELNFCGPNVVAIVGTEGNDPLTGTADVDGIMGMGGVDTIDPGDGVDAACAGDGNDVLLEQAEDGNEDFFQGDAGSDTLDVSTFSDVFALDLDITTSQPGGGGLGPIVQNTIENAIGGVHVDTLLGDAGPNRLDGNLGNDPMIVGNGGSDTLLGNAGNDGLFARDGVADVVDCGAGIADTAQTDRLSLDSVVNCESVDALPEPPVVVPPVTQAAVPPPAPATARKKCKKKKRAGAAAKRKCKRKKR